MTTKHVIEKKIVNWKHSLELIRTLANIINVAISVCVLLRVFKVI